MFVASEFFSETEAGGKELVGVVITSCQTNTSI